MTHTFPSRNLVVQGKADTNSGAKGLCLYARQDWRTSLC